MARDDAIAQLAEKAGDLAIGVAEKFIREKNQLRRQESSCSRICRKPFNIA